MAKWQKIKRNQRTTNSNVEVNKETLIYSLWERNPLQTLWKLLSWYIKMFERVL